MEYNQLFLAAKEGDIPTIEMLIYAKYIDVNRRQVGYILQVIIYLY